MLGYSKAADIKPLPGIFKNCCCLLLLLLYRILLLYDAVARVWINRDPSVTTWQISIYKTTVLCLVVFAIIRSMRSDFSLNYLSD